MAEYTPTDEDMRKRHRHAWEQSPVNRYALEEADAQWSRWLAAHDARVRREADAAERTAATGLAAAHRAIAVQARADGDPGRANLHDWAATQADLYTEEQNQ